MAAAKRRHKAQIRIGDPLLIATAGLLGALGDADEFPQDRAGIEALIAAIAKGPEGEEVWASYEDPDGPFTYLGPGGSWVAPAGDGRLRVRMRAFMAEEPASHLWILGPDGFLGDPETVSGYGVPEDELPPQVLAEIEETERRRQEAEARQPEAERRSEEFQNRFRLKHLRGVFTGPSGQDPNGPRLSHVLLYDSATLISYLLPRPDERGFDPRAPWDRPEVEPPPMALDDRLGTEFHDRSGAIDRDGEGPLRCQREFAPGVPTGAECLQVDIAGTRVTIDLGSG